MALLDGLGSAFKRLDCAVLGASDYVLGGFGRFTGLDQGLATRAINGLRRLRGCGEGGDIVIPPPPFTGGQCSGTLYRISGVMTRQIRVVSTGNVVPASEDVTSEIVYVGPITGIQGIVLTPQTSVIRVTHAGGITDAFFRQQPSTNTVVESVTFAGGATDASGTPGVCGDPPSDLPPPSNINIDVDVEFVDEGDNIVNITIPVEFKPFTVNFNGDVKFPFEFDLGGIDFNGDVSFAPKFELNVNPPRLSPGPPTPGTPADGDDNVPLAPRGDKVQGVIVTAQVSPDSQPSSVATQGMPNIFVPRLGSIKFAYSFGAATFWSNDIDVKGTRVFIPCPFSQGADAVAASPQPGVTFSVAQLTGPPLATVADLA